MKLEDVLALRLVGASSTDITAAIGRAEALQAELAERAAELGRHRAANLLTADDKTIFKAEQEAAAARLTADRIESLLPAMQADLVAAQGRETRDELRAEMPAVAEAMTRLHEWQVEAYPQVLRMIREGIRLQDEGQALMRNWLYRVELAYQRQEVRDAGPLDADLPAIPLSAPLPRSAFPFFQ